MITERSIYAIMGLIVIGGVSLVAGGLYAMAFLLRHLAWLP